MVARRTTDLRLLGWEERGDARPPLIGELESLGIQHLDRGQTHGAGVLSCSAGGMAARRHRLVAPPEARPGEPEAEVLGRLTERQEQAARLRYRQGDQVGCRSPFLLPSCSAALAWIRITSR
jgi:hypothetical protein